jgi:hypothetical protein
MKRVLYFLFACSSVLLMACPLLTHEPISSDQAVKTPSWLTGTWVEVKDEAPTGTSYMVKTDPSGPGKLKIYKLDKEGKMDNADVRPAVLSTVKGHNFISVYEKGDEATETGYYHYAIDRFENGDLKLLPLEEHMVESEASGQALAAYISEHADHPEHFLDAHDIERYRKQK